MATDIIDCGGKYEAHPLAGGGWAVVNGETGDVRCEFGERHDAVIAKMNENA